MGLALGHHIPRLGGNPPPASTCSYSIKFDGPSAYSPVLIFRYDLRFRPDGLRVFVRQGVGTNHPAFDNLYQFDLATPWQLTGWVFAGSLQVTNDSFARTLDWHDNGTKITLLNRWFSSFRRLDTWDMSATPYDISSGFGPGFASRVGIPGSEFLVRFNLETAAGGTSSGSHLFITRGNKIERHFMTVPHDISTMVIAPDQSFDTVPFGVAINTCEFSADHTRLYSLKSNHICSWDLTAPDDISAPFNFQTGPNINEPPLATMGVARGMNIRPDTGDIFLFGDQNNFRFRCWSGVDISGAVDPNFTDVVLLLDFEGADGAQAITDLSNSAHSDVFQGNAQVDVGRRHVGKNTLLLDGVGDEVTFEAGDPDWDFGTGDFTVEFGMLQDDTTTMTMLGNFDTTSGWFIQSLQSGGSKFVVGHGASTLINVSWTPPTSGIVLEHIALVRQGSTLTVYQQGVVLASVSDSTNITGSTAVLRIGSKDGLSEFYEGSIGGVRITKGLARYTAPFTPPTCFYPVQ